MGQQWGLLHSCALSIAKLIVDAHWIAERVSVAISKPPDVLGFRPRDLPRVGDCRGRDAGRRQACSGRGLGQHRTHLPGAADPWSCRPWFRSHTTAGHTLPALALAPAHPACPAAAPPLGLTPPL